ncbi:nitrogen fixation protein FixH [Chryseobacterium sp. 6424]|uniref:FixH family protein n=1 Tax=Chryseobacterium sp. 6424 TaxID=2039166 RepID=UPI000EFC8037|nr:FixH family protein [Chryseobacterium sp. 6424]AYO56777.1 nitrogen fixation protein FixH [Chryseobacterium sp. 6424]
MLKNFSWGHGIVLALGSFIAFILFLIFVFSNGMKNSELISDNYYQEELVYQETIDAKNNAENLPEKPSYEQNKAGITITFPQNIKPETTQVEFNLFRTDDSNLDVKKEVNLNGNGQFTIPSKVIMAGSYTLKLKWQKDNKPYQVDYDVLWK